MREHTPRQRPHGPLTDGALENPEARVAFGREVIRQEAEALSALAAHLDRRFADAVTLVLGCQGQVILTGMGKAGIVAQKVAATLASTGTPSQFLHPAEAVHGDLGRVRSQDLVIALSNSGETEEIRRLLGPLKRIGARLIAVTGSPRSTLALHADLVLDIGRSSEACPVGLAPTTSTTAMLALGDALAMTVAKARRFSVEEFAFYHPAGALGRQLMRVEEVMRAGAQHTVVLEELTCLEVLRRINATPGRPGAASVVDRSGRLVGFITDGDIVRLLDRGREFLDRPVREVMTRDPKVIAPDRLAAEAYRLMQEKKVDQLPVIDEEGRPIGLIDVQDLLDIGKG